MGLKALENIALISYGGANVPRRFLPRRDFLVGCCRLLLSADASTSRHEEYIRWQIDELRELPSDCVGTGFAGKVQT